LHAARDAIAGERGEHHGHAHQGRVPALLA
jgi:hypothetical protein